MDNPYANGKIYAIRNTINDKVYIGSTIQDLSKRMSEHRRCRTKQDKKHYALYRAFDELGTSMFYIELLEDYPCQSIEHLRQREGHYIRQYNSYLNGYNQRLEGRTIEEWRLDNKEHVKEQRKQYRMQNKELITQQKKNSYEKNKEKRLEYLKNYRDSNKEKITNLQLQTMTCPYCQREMQKYYIPKHIKTQHSNSA